MPGQNPKILSLGFSVPKYSANQEEALEALGWKSLLAKKIFRNTGIERRYSYIPIKTFAEGYSWQQATQWYKKGAVELGVKAAKDALDSFPIKRIGLIGFCSVTGYECPSLSYAIAAKLKLRHDVIHSNILGQGCQAASPLLERATDYVKAHPDKLALTISAEICSATWFPAPETDIEYVVSAAIFSDGASSAIVGYSDDPRYPEVIDYESYFDYKHLDLLGFNWKEGRLKVVLSIQVPNIVPPLIRKTIDILLERNGLKRRDVSYWILHPGGKTVLEKIEKELKLSHEQTYWSWEVMRRYGNMSSATIGAIAKCMSRGGERKEGYGVVATMGAGTAVNAALLKWGTK